MIHLVESAQISFFQNVLFGCFNIDAFRIVDGSICVADADHFDAGLVSKRKGRDRSDISESLHDGGAFLGIDL